MELLTHLQRRVWTLHTRRKLGTSAIASVVGMKPQSVHSIIVRCRDKLEKFAKHGDEARRLLKPPKTAKPSDIALVSNRWPWWR